MKSGRKQHTSLLMILSLLCLLIAGPAAFQKLQNNFVPLPSHRSYPSVSGELSKYKVATGVWMIKAHLILSQTRLIFSRLTDFSSVLTEFHSIWSDFWSDSDPNPIQTRPAPRPGYIRNKTLKIPFHPQTGRERVWLSHWAISGDSSGDLFFLSRSLYFLRRSSSDAGQLRRTHFSSDFSSAQKIRFSLHNNPASTPKVDFLNLNNFSSNFDYFLNVGGLVKAGLDVAQIWLDGDETLVNTIDRDGNMLPINMTNGHALTRDPLVVIVKKHQSIHILRLKNIKAYSFNY
ncbi:hypothetical protein LXL04_017374 [Taraxacum kok-saghyz]